MYINSNTKTVKTLLNRDISVFCIECKDQNNQMFKSIKVQYTD